MAGTVGLVIRCKGTFFMAIVPILDLVDEFLTMRYWFKDETLKIPQLTILYTARSRFLNFVAFEECHFNCSNDITTYLFFMDDLIDFAEDVRHLLDCGIMRHGRGSETEVADLVKQICKEVVSVDSRGYLSDLSMDVDTYSSNKWNAWIVILELKYFSNPWSIISLIAAFILPLLTLTQTLYEVFGYYRPGS
ncbi:hypothetical protein EUGRSUZ_L00668 [Eucalyptus grandis]|uniref:Uncharacterized protein n=1 Tax=Eucalyptus grandis TaxID=71139 RepID=A0A058ZVV8_EUCGR|nr:hypothetical protein EUGRSUZ_L00668 [Eucalyptus grandis]